MKATLYKVTGTPKKTIYISKNFAKELGVVERNRIYVKFGSNFMEARLITIDGSNTALGLSECILEELFIPLFCQYEVKVTRSYIEIGPYLGILASYSKESLLKRKRFFLNYTAFYNKINGVIMLFSLDQVDKTNDQINGYVYNPEKNDWETWDAHIPSVVFKKIRLDPIWRNYFINHTCCRLFNDYVPDKYEVYAWLKEDKEITNRLFLPETERLKDRKQLLSMLDKYPELMLKPIKGSQGRGIEVIDRNNFHEYLTRAIFNGSYILQQRIPLLQIDNGIIDFRLILIKDELGRWEDIDLIVRQGKTGKIISNVSAGGIAMEYSKFLASHQIGEHLQKQDFRSLMKSCSILIGQSLENKGVQLGNLGIDYALDTHYNLWLIEVNSLDPNHTIVIDAGKDRSVLQNIYYKNLAYARYLAGYK